MNIGNGRTMYKIPMNCALKNSKDDKLYVMYILPQFKGRKERKRERRKEGSKEEKKRKSCTW